VCHSHVTLSAGKLCVCESGTASVRGDGLSVCVCLCWSLLFSDDYFRMKLQWKSIDADQESRFSDLKDRRSLIGMFTVSLSVCLSVCLSLCLSFPCLY